MNIQNLKKLLVHATSKRNDLLAWRDDGSFSRWNDEVTRILSKVLPYGNTDLVRWNKRVFGPLITFSTTTQFEKDDIFIAAVNDSINHLSDIIHHIEPIDTNKTPTLKKSDKANITTNFFEVAFSFPGDVRDYVEKIADILSESLGINAVFYDNNFKAQLARPSLDVVLQNIYRNQAKLVVVFLCEKYQEKQWCGVEFRAIKESLFDREYDKIMFVRMDDGSVEGIFKTDGYIDGARHSAAEVAEFINERLALLP